ncbi:alcohol dehydrogenase catalytic domain-containing protein [Kamptonema cortianum]|nr:alcohol dehydrogenase catalytic domain-containing protein [Geitlerinema splendidum]MDK3155347.1 alcohol dehydrogenase catalytic domain-containing protein [Kamptonema cortianum]
MTESNSSNGKMKALVLMAPGDLRLDQIDVPQPSSGEILIRVEAATTCGTDLKAFLRGHPQIPMPGVFGHEYSGTVVSVGSGAPFAVGDAVMGVHSAPCQQCKWCLSDKENLCESIMATKVLGSYAQYLLIPERIARLNVYPKPESLSFEVASLLEPLACVAHGLERAKPNPQTDVLVIGPGAIGLMFVAALRHLGVKSVTLAGRNAARLATGESLGAKPAAIDKIQHQFDLVIECTGSVEVWEKSLGFVRRGGTLMLFGGCPAGSTAAFDTRRLHYDDITLMSPFHFGTRAVRTARSWLMDDGFCLKSLFSGDRELSDGPQVFRDLEHGKGIKYVFRP